MERYAKPHMESPHNGSLFALTPRELRDSIYKHVVSCIQYIDHLENKRIITTRQPTWAEKRHGLVGISGILLVNHQMKLSSRKLCFEQCLTMSESSFRYTKVRMPSRARAGPSRTFTISLALEHASSLSRSSSVSASQIRR